MNSWHRKQFPTAFRVLSVSRSSWLLWLKISVVALAFGLVVLIFYIQSTANRFLVSHETLNVGGETREYRLVRPSNETAGKKMPVIFAFHGALDLTDEMAVYTGSDDLVEDHEILLVYPQGGAMVNLIVNFCSERVAAAVCNCGWLPKPLGDSDLLTAHKCPMLFIVGENDRQVPPKVVDEARQAFATAGHLTEWLEIPDFGHGWARDRGLNPVVWNFLQSKVLQTTPEDSPSIKWPFAIRLFF